MEHDVGTLEEAKAVIARLIAKSSFTDPGIRRIPHGFSDGKDDFLYLTDTTASFQRRYVRAERILAVLREVFLQVRPDTPKADDKHYGNHFIGAHDGVEWKSGVGYQKEEVPQDPGGYSIDGFAIGAFGLEPLKLLLGDMRQALEKKIDLCAHGPRI